MHIPVLTAEVVKYLNPRPDEQLIDCTLGNAGHAIALLEKTAPKGKLLGIDWDASSIQRARAQIKAAGYQERATLVQDNFANLKEIAQSRKFVPVGMILMDLGFSSDQLEASGKGFSFQKSEPLDMRYSQDNPLTAEKIVNYWSRGDIEKILKEYGEEECAKEIARSIVAERSGRHIATTSELADIIKNATPAHSRHKGIHPATKTFQALRIAVNAELDNLSRALPRAMEILAPGGRLAVIAFHSLEDRIIKQFFREAERPLAGNPLVRILTKKPVCPAPQEIKNNPRSRSAKLRAAIKIS